MICPLDKKRCYVHYHSYDGLPSRCRNGSFLEGTFCPYEQKEEISKEGLILKSFISKEDKVKNNG